MRHYAIAAVLLWGMAMSAARGAELPGDRIATDKGDLVIHPVRHATLVLQWDGKTIYVDPVGGGKLFAGLPKPDVVLVTHIHGDHFDAATIEAVVGADAKPILLVPKSVAEKLPETLRGKVMLKTLANGEKTEAQGVAIDAVPAYNITISFGVVERGGWQSSPRRHLDRGIPSP